MNPTRLDPADGPSTFTEILDELSSFWGDRADDLRPLHHPLWLRQCAADALVVREQNTVVGYLLGVVTVHQLAYVHLVAVRQTDQKRGLGSRLYRRFVDAARQSGAQRVEAITTPTNSGSIAFHKRLGFSAELVPCYAGPGQDRVLFRLGLSH